MLFKIKGDDSMSNMTPSNITTDGQINEAVSNYRAILEKHSGEFCSESVQTVLGQPELAEEMFRIFQKRVETISSMIVRHVKVDRSRTYQQVLDATKREQYTNSDVVASMPKGEGDEIDVYFFKLGRFISDDDLEKEYTLRGLKNADTYSQSAVNETDPAFADEHPNGTHWKDANGKWCFATFLRWYGRRSVSINRGGNGWDDNWWFAGLRK